MNIFEEIESEVRSYCRSFPAVFDRAVNAFLYDTSGKEYVDFFAGAGAMNFGHSNKTIKDKVLEYLSEDNIIHALDMNTKAKGEFLETFRALILKPRNLDYKVMCCGPTGTNAVEAALKLARKNKRRTNIIAFSGAFHGMTMGSLAATTDRKSRGGAGVPLQNITFAPYCNQFGDYRKSLEYLEWMLFDDHSGIDKPACILLETIQAEGGINVAEHEWLRGVRNICDRYDILMVVDDIQVGVGRNETFFSWERSGIVPDMVTLSKSIGGIGLPMSLLLIKSQYDIFRPSEHNGTYRGFQLSFVSAKAGIEYFIENHMEEMTHKKSEIIRNYLEEQIKPLSQKIEIRGSGLIWGVDLIHIDETMATEVMRKCFKSGLILERAGRHDSVVKILPPLTIEEETLLKGLDILKECIKAVLQNFQ